MTKKDLVKIIREVVRREVKVQMENVLTEMESKKQNERLSINEAIEQTDVDYPTLNGKVFTSADARAGFAALQTGYNQPPQQTDLHGKPVDINNLGGGLDKALTRDYSKLVKRFNK